MANKLFQSLTDKGKLSLAAVLSWILYDAANSFFQLGVGTLYFPLWIVQDMGLSELHYSWVVVFTQIIIILTAPVVGALLDKHHKKKWFLVYFTLQAVIFTALFGFGGLLFSIIFYVLAYLGMQLSQVIYDSYLVQVSTEKNRGLISGIGIAFGQVGYLVIILLLLPVVTKSGRGAAFLPIAFLFLMFALPALVFLKEKNRSIKTSVSIKYSVNRVLKTIRNLKKYPGTLRYYISRFFYSDAMHTVYFFLAIYFTSVFGFSDTEVQYLFAFLIIFSIIGGLLSAHLIDRLGVKKFQRTVLFFLVICLFSLALVKSRTLIIIFGILSGLIEGCIWSGDRIIITKLSPHNQLTEFFGLYAMLGRFASIIGPLIWGVTVHALAVFGTEISHRIAMGSLAVMALAALIIFLPLKIPD
ncbi:TPA: MFS transporter [Candidatus Woesearchaeota archaeon]|nr:Major facilitator superfamily MFS_1 [archaeon GW2011_AR15]MBS3104420.1 MFS transporter [Candidatus Woesearchaeota archaeon]HIH41267.1 MFS transporter [Candidatus Woesearchaeota archaeon]